MTENEITQGRYIGDGVYVSSDGYQLWLAVNDHQNKVVALEPDVLDNLIQYNKELSEFYKRETMNGKKNS